MAEIAILVLLAAGAMFVTDSMRARERAHASGRRACERNNLQFLDDTVELISLRLARDGSGRVRLRRIYAFEFSDPLLAGGDNRRGGSVTLFRSDIESVMLDPFVDETAHRLHQP